MKIINKNLYIDRKETIIDALNQMNSIGKKMLLVMNDGIFESIISIGDIQRAIIKNIALSAKIYNILRDSITVGHVGQSEDEVKNLMIINRIEYMPILNSKNEVDHIIEWDDIVKKLNMNKSYLRKVKLVIMAGGEGRRLLPITKVIPKALIPINEKPIIQEIIDRFSSQGVIDTLVIANHKHDMIEKFVKDYIKDGMTKVIVEKKAMGTIGAITLLIDKLKETFILSNCDVIVEFDYAEIVRYHKKEMNILTIVSAVKAQKIPYGVMISENGLLLKIEEKPELKYQINTGLYIIEPDALDFLIYDEPNDMVKFIEVLKMEGKKVGVYPIPEKCWYDMGSWDEYIKMKVHLESDDKQTAYLQ